MLCVLATREGDTRMDVDAIPMCSSLLSACCGLIVIDEHSNFVRLVHCTAEEYFERKQKSRDAKARDFIDRRLITYLGFPNFARINLSRKFYQGDPLVDLESTEDHLQVSVLLQYAVKNWGDHAREALDVNFAPGRQQSSMTFDETGFGFDKRSTESMVLTFLKRKVQKPCSPISFQTPSVQILVHPPATSKQTQKPHLPEYLDTVQFLEHEIPDLHLLASFGILYLVKLLLGQSNALVNAEDSKGCTALHYAASEGHVAVVRYLLEDCGSNLEARD